MRMAKNKYETHVLPNLEKITSWAKAGGTSKDIASKLKIAYSTFRKYLDEGEKGDERYTALSEAFAQACEIPDDNVETALYKRACGYQYTEETKEEKLDKSGKVVVLRKSVVRDVPPDPTSAMFWLTNRRRDKWKYKPEAQGDEDAGETGVIMLAPAGEEPRPREEGEGE